MTQPARQACLDLSDFEIDRDAEVPIGVQLAWTLRAQIDSGRCEPGERLPGMRELAQATGVNINTVKAVYQRLEREGLIDTQQGSGTFVGATRRPRDATAIVANAVREARETGVDPRDVAAALYVSLKPPASTDTDSEAERRRMLRTQIASLELALGEIEAEHPGVAGAPVKTPGSAGPALLGAEQLEQVRTHLVRRLASVQAAIDEQEQPDGHPPTAKKAKSAGSSTLATKPKGKPASSPRATPRAAPASG